MLFMDWMDKKQWKNELYFKIIDKLQRISDRLDKIEELEEKPLNQGIQEENGGRKEGTW